MQDDGGQTRYVMEVHADTVKCSDGRRGVTGAAGTSPMQAPSRPPVGVDERSDGCDGGGGGGEHAVVSLLYEIGMYR